MERGVIENTGMRGFGYITPDNPIVRGPRGMRNLFFHQSEVSGFVPKIGDRVTFEVGEYKGQPVAKNVRPIAK